MSARFAEQGLAMNFSIRPFSFFGLLVSGVNLLAERRAPRAPTEKPARD